jgi:hypothetical protein
MKLITETVEHVEYLTEEVDGKKSLFITGPFLAGECVNKNGRLYPISLLEREVAAYTKERIQGKCAWGELNHPATPTVNLDRACIMVKDLHREGNNYIGKAKVLEGQPMGAIVKGLIDEGGNLGVSSRGVGSLKQNSKGFQEVQEDFRLCVAADIVSDPSGPGCFVQGIIEGVEWIYDSISGTWVEQKVHELKKELRAMTKEQREARALKIFEALITDISGLRPRNK